MLENSRVAAKMVVSQEGLSSMELVSFDCRGLSQSSKTTRAREVLLEPITIA
jgi:hypothetical protein